MTPRRCPFCSGLGTRMATYHARKGTRVVCMRFDCGMAGPWRLNAEAARAAWNRIEIRSAR